MCFWQKLNKVLYQVRNINSRGLNLDGLEFISGRVLFWGRVGRYLCNNVSAATSSVLLPPRLHPPQDPCCFTKLFPLFWAAIRLFLPCFHSLPTRQNRIKGSFLVHYVLIFSFLARSLVDVYVLEFSLLIYILISFSHYFE